MKRTLLAGEQYIGQVIGVLLRKGAESRLDGLAPRAALRAFRRVGGAKGLLDASLPREQLLHLLLQSV